MSGVQGYRYAPTIMLSISGRYQWWVAGGTTEERVVREREAMDTTSK